LIALAQTHASTRTGRPSSATRGNRIRTRAAISALAAAPLALALAQPARAQDDDGRRFHVEAAVRVGHDTNVAKSSKEAARAAGINPSDTVISPSLTLNILQPLSRQAFYARGLIAADYYSKNDFYNSARSDLNLGFNLHAGPCDGGLDQSFQRNRAAAQALALVATRNIQKTETTSFRAACGRQVGFAPTAEVSHSTGKNSDALLQGSDFETWSYTLGLAYRRPGFGEVSIFGRQADTDNENRVIVVAGVPHQDGYRMTSAGVRYVRRLGARLQGDIEASYTKIEPELAVTEDFSGFTYGLHIDFRPQSRLQTQLAFVREVTPSQQLGASYSVVTTERLQATYELGRRLSVEGGISRADSQYHGAAQLQGITVSDEVFSTLNAGARFALGRRVFLTADTRWEKRNTDVVGLDYSSNLTSVGVAAKF
jgi:hypothetical protein